MPTARVIPTLYQNRSPVSLHDAQYTGDEKVPIPEAVIQEVLTALQRFKRTCRDFLVLVRLVRNARRVWRFLFCHKSLLVLSRGATLTAIFTQNEHIEIVATEATRNAINSQIFIQEIEEKVGWRTNLLSKEDEGRLGAMGVASSVTNVTGLVMDFGGGSLQLTWVSNSKNGDLSTGPTGSISLPFGAAALMTRIQEFAPLDSEGSVFDEVVQKLQKALLDLKMPPQGPLTLYLSGGGFRGWGHILMSMDSIQPYPIPIANGYRISGPEFLPELARLQRSVDSHRVSKRRASQVPAARLVVRALLQVLPAPTSIGSVIFCQGGVREGVLYSKLPKEIRQEHPLVAATRPFAPSSSALLMQLLQKGIPEECFISNSVSPLLEAAINLLYAHASNPKDIRCSAALRSTTTGVLSDVHGLMHEDRALLGLVLCERWRGDVPPADKQFFENLQALVGPQASWWAKYIGRLTEGIANVYPAGMVETGTRAVDLALVTDSAEGSLCIGIQVNAAEAASVVDYWWVTINILQIVPAFFSRPVRFCYCQQADFLGKWPPPFLRSPQTSIGIIDHPSTSLFSQAILLVTALTLVTHPGQRISASWERRRIGWVAGKVGG